jgi:hypothetical protein
MQTTVDWRQQQSQWQQHQQQEMAQINALLKQQHDQQMAYWRYHRYKYNP